MILLALMHGELTLISRERMISLLQGNAYVTIGC